MTENNNKTSKNNIVPLSIDNQSIWKNKIFVKTTAVVLPLALITGIGLGYVGYGAMNNQVIASGSGMTLTKADITDKMTSASSSMIFTTVRDEALQKLYPQKVLSSDTELNAQADKLLDKYVSNNGGYKVLNASLKKQNTTLKKWRATMLPQAKAQVTATAQAKQSVDAIKDAGVVTTAQVTKASKDYIQYTSTAYLAKDEDGANKLMDTLKNNKTPEVSAYTQKQDNLKVSSLDSIADSSDVLASLKSTKSGDVVKSKMSSGGGYYVFKVKSIEQYSDFKNDNDAGAKDIQKTVRESLNEQAALASTTLGTAEAKVFKKNNIHFKDSNLDKSFYSTLKNASLSSSSAMHSSNE